GVGRLPPSTLYTPLMPLLPLPLVTYSVSWKIVTPRKLSSLPDLSCFVPFAVGQGSRPTSAIEKPNWKPHALPGGPCCTPTTVVSGPRSGVVIGTPVLSTTAPGWGSPPFPALPTMYR